MAQTASRFFFFPFELGHMAHVLLLLISDFKENLDSGRLRFFLDWRQIRRNIRSEGELFLLLLLSTCFFLGGILADEKTCPSPFKLNVLCINGRPSEKINTMVRMDGKTDDACTNQQEERDKREQGRAEASSGNNIGSEEEEEKGGGRARRWQSV